MAANLGAGIGSFMTGLSQGASIRSQLENDKISRRVRGLQMEQLEQENADRQNLRGVMTRASSEAAGARQAAIDQNIQVGSADQGGMTVPTYSVSGKNYATKEEADKAASDGVGTFLDFYMKTSAPALMQHWAETGELDKAQAFNKWMEDENVKKGTKAWAGAVRSFQIGDREGFKQNLMKAYNQQGYFDDGMTATKIDDVKNDKGQLLGYAITFKDGDGKESTQTYDGDDVAQMGLQAMAPDQVLSYGLDQLKQKQVAQLAMAKEARGLSNDLLKIQAQHQNRLSEQSHNSGLRRAEKQEALASGAGSKKVIEANAIAGALRANGADESTVRSLYPQLLGVERASRSKQDRLDGYISNMAKANMDFAELSVAEQVAQATKLMEQVDNAAKPTPAQAQSRSGASGGNAVQSGRGVPLLDSKTNQIIYK